MKLYLVNWNIRYFFLQLLELRKKCDTRWTPGSKELNNNLVLFGHNLIELCIVVNGRDGGLLVPVTVILILSLRTLLNLLMV